MWQYKQLVRRVLSYGEHKEDRTGTGTISVFGTQHRFKLSGGVLPLVTTKKVNFKAVVAELLWFLSGSTNVNDLNSKIWDPWADENGNLGPIYSHQWRSWGGAHHATLSTGAQPGVDQITNVIESLKNNPCSRRHIVSAWNVEDIPYMALPPCHLLFQFYVRRGRYLDCQLYQRSADIALGVPFNIASYALLTHMMAQETGLTAGEFVHTIGDAHIYLNHREGLQEQLRRIPRSSPVVEITKGKSIFDIKEEDVVLHGYNPHPAIKFKIAV
jgi:thymidylate synthase